MGTLHKTENSQNKIQKTNLRKFTVSQWMTELADSKLDDRVCKLKDDIQLVNHIPESISCPDCMSLVTQ